MRTSLPATVMDWQVVSVVDAEKVLGAQEVSPSLSQARAWSTVRGTGDQG